VQIADQPIEQWSASDKQRDELVLRQQVRVVDSDAVQLSTHASTIMRQ
jgi:hypothetical protein